MTNQENGMNEPKSYTKKPVTIQAIEWTGDNETVITEFVGAGLRNWEGELFIKTLEGEMHASIGDFIIKGVGGEFYPCKPDIFAQTYD